MFQRTRHFAPAFRTWDASEAQAAIQEIAADALTMRDPVALWPSHPMDDGLPDGMGSIYFGAAGVIWALDYLHRAGAIADPGDLAPLLERALERNAPWYAKTFYPNHASLLFGELGIRLVQMRVKPEPGIADTIHALAATNNNLPTVELMWGLPGSMLACVFMRDMADDARFRALFQTQAARLLGELETNDDAPIWTQDLYAGRARGLGPVHGFAGNMLPLVRGWDWLSHEQRAIVADAAPRTLEAYAVRSPLGATWPPAAPSNSPPTLCQHCHGAPGIVTAFAEAPFSTPEFERSLLQAGELTWNAGPLVKGSNLCHGTGGNGYAFLKLYRRTNNRLWLDRARAFAMAAIDQVRGARAAFGRGRYSLWTGDAGLAVYLWHCTTGEPRFPTIDVL